ncbi:MAG TPA: hypothetical protein VFZ16_12855 [Hyphomicrobiaceae bacterium]|nr:hypothetical protein [Hyphomicrobiaceae bacterium]
MQLTELIAQVSGYETLAPREKIRLFAWHLHAHRSVEVIDNSSIRECFRELHEAPPDVTVYLPRMADGKPADLVRVRGGYKLAGSVKRALDAKYGTHQSVIAVIQLLAELPAKVPDLAERAFLSEAINCYRAQAFRAAIVMAWNLAFDHLLGWVAASASRLAKFNAAIAQRYPKSKVEIHKRADFEELKEAEVVEVCLTAGLLTKNAVEILREKLKRRNIAAHPSQVVIVQHQADDVITDLVNNVVLALR